MPTIFKTKRSIDTRIVSNAIRNAGFKDISMVVSSDDNNNTTIVRVDSPLSPEDETKIRKIVDGL
ncbi:MAG: hypothetical protein ABSA50_06580 [Candidatus Bathyarchaeia archaeon]|jgi:hypothetical protein